MQVLVESQVLGNLNQFKFEYVFCKRLFKGSDIIPVIW